jgi:hypothetical protein
MTLYDDKPKHVKYMQSTDFASNLNKCIKAVRTRKSVIDRLLLLKYIIYKVYKKNKSEYKHDDYCQMNIIVFQM